MLSVPNMSWSDLVPEQQILIVAATETIRSAETLLDSCEHCNPTGAVIPFEWLLDLVTGCDSTITSYIMEVPGRCPICLEPIFEKTLIEQQD